MDSAYIATTAEDSACRVWEVAKRESIAQLPRDQGEKFGYCRFSRNGTQAFLFVTYTKGKKGCVGVWNMEDWSKVGYKKLADAPIASLAVSRDGKFLGLGTTEGDVAVVMIKKMEVMQLIGSVHNAPVTGLEFSKHGRAILSVGGDATAHINRLKKSEWKEWQLYSLLFAMILVSGLLFWAFFESSLSDRFWQFPMGRQQPARPPPEAIYGWPVGYQEPEATGL
jgi:prolactin regulatory element-binding protein